MVIEFGILAAFAAMLLWGFSDFMIQKSTRKMGDFETLAFMSIVGSALLAPFALADISAALLPGNLLLLLLLSCVGFVGWSLDYDALKRGKLSVVEVIIEIELPITVGLGIVFFGESLGLLQWALMGSAFIGIILIALRSLPAKRAIRLEKGAIIAFAVAAGSAGVSFLTASASRSISPFMALWFPWVVVGLLSLAVVCKRDGIRKFARNVSRFRRYAITATAFDVSAWVLFAFALVGNKLAVTAAIVESYVAVAVLLGIFVNKERIRHYQVIGAVIAVAAS